MSDGATEMMQDEKLQTYMAMQEMAEDFATADHEIRLTSDAVNVIAEPVVRSDMVNHPPHYTQHKWEVIEVLEEYFPQDPLLFNVGKYILRSPYKGAQVQDLEKAAWYLNRKIAKLKGAE